jgi:RHS repeat-associated protein
LSSHADHLNTPRLVADATGTTVWRWDQAEPFGNNPADENPNGLGAFDLPLRLPGQRYDKETGLAYNMARDYASDTGRYVQSDPIGLRGGLNTYLYVSAIPLRLIDPTGLKSRVCCKNVVPGVKHCYIETQNSSGRSTVGLAGGWYLGMPGCGQVLPNYEYDKGGTCGPWNGECLTDQCVKDHADFYPNPSRYAYLFGDPNSNSFAGEVARSCGLKRPGSVTDDQVPGWSGRNPPVPFPGVPQVLPVWPIICPPPLPAPVSGD